MQLIKVTAFSPNRPEGALICYECNQGILPCQGLEERSLRNSAGAECPGYIPVLLGKNGVTRNKKEGDGKTPLGTFPLGLVFGDNAHKAYAAKNPYLLLEQGMEWVDDPTSPHYNQLIKPNFSGPRNWTSSEKMWEIALYALGVVVEYNTNPIIPGIGSAIFMHTAQEGGTAGCISMNESDLCKVIAWLDPSKNPKIEIR
jgi:L,D-peptidoglycan transpeptidase YkuD (ErfK/YbiS/YcfS/YnhG family)